MTPASQEGDARHRPAAAVVYQAWDGGTGYDWRADETAAARAALALEMTDRPHRIWGVEFADGRTVDARRWAVLARERERLWGGVAGWPS